MFKKGKAVCAFLALITAISVILPGAFSLRADAVSAGDIQTLTDETIQSEISLAGAESLQALLDGKYAQGAGSVSDWFVLSLIQYKGEGLDYSRYAQSLREYCGEKNSHDTPVSKERIAVMFILLNTNESYIRNTADTCVGSFGLMSYIYGLHLTANGFPCSKMTDSEIIGEILASQLDDGGWDIQKKAADPDVTAMAVQALAHYYAGNAKVRQAVDKALARLSSLQLSNGSYKSYGAENPESCAQVITALTALGINPLTDGRFIKNGKSAVDAMLAYRLSSGGFCHKQGGEYNATATSQVLYSLVSVYRLQKGTGSLYNLRTGIKTSSAPEKTSPSQTPAGKAEQAGRVITSKASTTASSGQNTTGAPLSATQAKSEIVTFTSSSRKERGTKPAKEETFGIQAAISETPTEKTTAAPPVTTSAVVRPDSLTETEAVTTGRISPAPDETTSVTETSVFPVEDREETSAQSSESETVSSTETKTVPGETADNGKTESSLSKPKKIIIAAVWSVALAAAIILLIKKNKKAVNYAVIIGVAAALTAGTVFADIQSADDYYRAEGTSSPDTITVTMSISCDTVKGRGDESITPSDGIILPETEFVLDSGATVYDCLIKAAKQYKIRIEDNTQALGNHSAAYIAGINYLYEFDYGELSGWMFSVNGEFADRGCGEYELSDSDSIRWEYTCNMGDDLK